MISIITVYGAPAERSLLAQAAKRAGLTSVELADPIVALAAILEHDPALVIVGDNPGGVDGGRYMALLTTHFPQIRRATLGESTGRAWRLKSGAGETLSLALPTTRAELDALAAQLKAAVE